MAGKLELTWVGKDEAIRVEPRLLIEDAARSNIAKDPETSNMLIHGDNLLALKALEHSFAGKVKCIYIDPPFNTGARIDADGKEIGYDDGVEHSIWLNLMAERLRVIHNLLRDDGALFIHLDDNEVDYCRVLTDEIFGRENFMNRITVDSRSPSAFSTVNPGVFKAAEYILFYAKRRSDLVENQLRTERMPDPAYDKYILNIDEEYEIWEFIPIAEAYEKFGSSGNSKPQLMIKNYNKFIVENAHRIFRFTSISDTGAGQAVVALKNQSKECPDKIFRLERKSLDDLYILNGQQISFYEKNIAVIDGKKCASKILTDIWSDIAWEGIAKEGSVKFKKGKKPERLIKRCLELVTSPGDLVLDSFLGSGTTAAVAHKMKRKYIGIEMADHCYSHCKPRLDRIIDGSDKGGISKIVDWQGGGGYRFFELAPTLIEKDSFDEPVIHEAYDANMLAAAVALHEGFRYQPDASLFWKQSVGSDRSFLFVTTRHVTSAYLDAIRDTMADGEYLLIACTSFEEGLSRAYKNISIKKIPQMLLSRCEFGRADYNLNIVRPPVYEDEEGEDE